MKIKNLVECKSIGVHLTERQARAIDDLVRTLPKECAYKRKGRLPEAAELIAGERADISLVSVESVDREGDVILAKGINLDYFQLNPIVCYAHRYDDLPVGLCQWIRKVQGGIKAKTIYSEATETSRAVWQMTQEGILRGKSIGFLPTKIRSATQDEITRNPAWKNAGAIIESAVLLEYSIAPIPVNQDALVQAVAKGMTDRATLKRLGLPVPEPKRLSQQEMAEIIRKEFSKAVVEFTPEKIRDGILSKYRA